MVNDAALSARAEPFDLEHMPKEVLVLTAGADVQDDRIEITVCGWTRDGDCLILGHQLIWGSFADHSTWDEVDEFLRAKWPHPFDGKLGIAAANIDCGDGDHSEAVINFCVPRASRRIFAIKGMPGAGSASRWPRARRSWTSLRWSESTRSRT
jgi:phage terminase large subunit GpA-like protein